MQNLVQPRENHDDTIQVAPRVTQKPERMQEERYKSHQVARGSEATRSEGNTRSTELIGGVYCLAEETAIRQSHGTEQKDLISGRGCKRDGRARRLTRRG